MIGTVVGNYKVVAKIGEGGMGAVYKGVDLMLEREVAIKVLKPELASQPQVVERFRSEAVTLAKLNHPNIATLYNFFRQGDHFFMVLEFVNGTPLERIIEAHGVMTCEEAIPLFCQMLEGIEHAHSFGIIHRDIKPANMMLTQNGLLKVLDFGIARALGSARMTRAGNLIGTIEYMSPEQVRGIDTDARSDIYSLGMVLYEMLTGRVPFASDSEFELMKAQVEQLPTPPREFAPNIPEQVEWAILCATEKDPGKRFQSAEAFGGAIIDSVNTAISSGALSQIDMRGSTSRLSAAVVGRDRVNSRVSAPSSPGFSQVPISAETALPSPRNDAVPPPTRYAPVSPASAPVAVPIKATRLGDVSEFQTGHTMAPPVASIPAQSSFFGRLNRKHYILGGSALGLLFLGFVAIVLVVFLNSGGGSADSAGAPASSPPAEQATPTQFQELNSQPTDSQRELERSDPPAAAVAQPVEEIQENKPNVVDSGGASNANKTARKPAARKPRPSSRDVLGLP